MSKYYKAEDVQELITACEWQMTLAKECNGEGFVDYSKQILDIDELTKRLSDLPTIDIVTCKECKYWRTDEKVRCRLLPYADADDFCAYGERSEE